MNAESKICDSVAVRARDYMVVKRNGAIVPFQWERVRNAIRSAFIESENGAKIELQAGLEVALAAVERLTDQVVAGLDELVAHGDSLTVEGIQDVVECQLMSSGHHAVAKDYIIYRDKHAALRADAPLEIKIQKEDGSLVPFNPIRVALVLQKAFKETFGKEQPAEFLEAVNLITRKVVAAIHGMGKSDLLLSWEDVQEIIEEQLVKDGFFRVAKTLILQAARVQAPVPERVAEPFGRDPFLQKTGDRVLLVVDDSGNQITLHESTITQKVEFLARGYEADVCVSDIIDRFFSVGFEGMRVLDALRALIAVACEKIELDPSYAKVAARTLIDALYQEVLGQDSMSSTLEAVERKYFKTYIESQIAAGVLSPDLARFNLDKLSRALRLERDDLFSYLGIQTLYDRYFIRQDDRRIETPQIFWMRVAMGLAVAEAHDCDRWALEFYDLLSTMTALSSTPTLFNAGTTHPQLSSCYISTTKDELEHIFKTISDDAMLSKWAGGLANDMTNIRSKGSIISSTKGKSQGLVPFLKVLNSTAVAVNQGGKRKGVLAVYIEVWHLDFFESCIYLRKNTGDERLRTMDLNIAGWYPDLFFEYIEHGKDWYMFSPSDVPDLHDLYGKAFKKRYEEYVTMAKEGKIKLFKKAPASELWVKVLSMLFETGHPWITFKDPCNIRSPQDHVGVIHSSNLCTEIVQNTSPEETTVCSLMSVNLVKFVMPGGQVDDGKLKKAVGLAIRMLDNVIAHSFYPIPEARRASLNHRSIGLGAMGLQNALDLAGLTYDSPEAFNFTDRIFEKIAYHATLASAMLAKDRGAYSTFSGSKWDRGLFPIDTIALLEEERGTAVEMDRTKTLDWAPVYDAVKRYGLRNANLLSVAPTATIANIADVTPSLEPIYKLVYVKGNLSGEFVVVHQRLISELKRLGLWSGENREQIVESLKYYDGSIQYCDIVPDDVKRLFPTAFELRPDAVIEHASRAGKWVDQSISMNLWLGSLKGKELARMYRLAYSKGLKTTYYLRTPSATQIEKSTVKVGARSGGRPRWMETPATTCSLEDGCESCQ